MALLFLFSTQHILHYNVMMKVSISGYRSYGMNHVYFTINVISLVIFVLYLTIVNQKE